MRYVLFAFTAPWSVIVGWGWLLVLFCLGMVRDFRWEPTLVLTVVFRDWVGKPRKLPWSVEPTALWKFSITLGRGIAYQPGTRSVGGPWTSVQKHEHVHVRQAEDMLMLSFIIGLITFLVVGFSTGAWDTAGWLGLGLWFSGGAWQLPNHLTALLRHLGHVERPAGMTMLEFVVMEIMYRRNEHERSAHAQTDQWGPERKSWIDR